MIKNPVKIRKKNPTLKEQIAEQNFDYCFSLKTAGEIMKEKKKQWTNVTYKKND